MFIIGKHCYRSLNGSVCSHCVTVNVSTVYTQYTFPVVCTCIFGAMTVFYDEGLLILFSSAADESSNCIHDHHHCLKQIHYVVQGKVLDVMYALLEDVFLLRCM
jgi:hypothetical protein